MDDGMSHAETCIQKNIIVSSIVSLKFISILLFSRSYGSIIKTNIIIISSNVSPVINSDFTQTSYSI